MAEPMSELCRRLECVRGEAAHLLETILLLNLESCCPKTLSEQVLDFDAICEWLNEVECVTQHAIDALKEDVSDA